jgi:hypothetical protein
MKIFAAALLAAPTLCMAGSPFAGTWVIKPELTTYGVFTLNFKIEKGVYKRTGCVNPIAVPADGADHEVNNEGYFDSIRIRVLGRNRVEITQKAAQRVTWMGVYTVSPDQRRMTLAFNDNRAPETVTGELRYTRQGDVVAGGHAASGEWLPDKLSKLSPSGLRITFNDTDNGIAMSASDGRRFDAKFDRQEHPLLGDVEGATVRLGRIGADTIQIGMRQGRSVAQLSRATVSADGRSMTLIEVDENCHIGTSYVLQKISD